MTPVFGINAASCGKKLLRISEHLSEGKSLITLLKVRLYVPSGLISHCFRSGLADFVL